MAEQMNPGIKFLVILFGAGIAVIGYQPLKRQYGGIIPFLSSKSEMFARETLPSTIRLKRPDHAPENNQARGRLGSGMFSSDADNAPPADKINDKDRGALNSLINNLNK